MGWRPARAWTSQSPVMGYRHFRLVLQGGKGRERWVELEAVLESGQRCRVAWSELCDPAQWSSGWQQLPAAEAEAEAEALSTAETDGQAVNAIPPQP